MQNVVTDSHTNANSDANRHTDGNSYSDSDSHTNAHPNIDSDGNADGNSYAGSAGKDDHCSQQHRLGWHVSGSRLHATAGNYDRLIG